MTRATKIAGGAFAAALVLLAFVAVRRFSVEDAGSAAAPATPAGILSAESTPAAAPVETVDPGFLYGRITAVGGATYEGRLRWGGNQEAFWGDYFNGAKDKNPWAAQAQLQERRPLRIFGFEIGSKKGQLDLDRLFMARFGDIARIEARGRDVRVILKSGTAFDLDRMEASDFDDGVRVWDRQRGVVNLDSLRIRTIELLPAARPGAASERLHGTVRTRHGAFTGFVQWNREEGVGSDELDGRTADGDTTRLRFDTIRSIARRSRDSSLVTRLDGSEIELSGTREVGRENLGLYVDDPRYGRVLVSWDAFERVDFSPIGSHGSGPTYGDFPPGRPLTGSITTRDGRSLTGRLVYDLDESETTETLDAPSQGVDYTIPFGLVASIALPGKEGGEPRARVTLQNGEKLELELAGDLGEGNAGMLIFAGGRERADYVPWADVETVELDRPTLAP